MAHGIARKPDFIDLDLDFLKHPTTKDVVRRYGNDAIKRSIRNLIFTNYYDRPFRSYIGSNVRKLLFENATPLTEIFLKDAINETIAIHEPRVAVRQIEVMVSPDNNGFNVSLSYVIINKNIPVTISLFLSRIR